MTAIKTGILTPTTKTEPEKLETEHTRLLHALQGSAQKADVVVSFITNITVRFKRLIDNLAAVTQHQVDKARGILRELIGQQIVLHPTAIGSSDI